MEYLDAEPQDPLYYQPVFITPEERQKYCLHNVDSVKILIEDRIDQISQHQIANYHKGVLGDYKDAKLFALLDLLEEVNDYLGEENIYNDDKTISEEFSF